MVLKRLSRIPWRYFWLGVPTVALVVLAIVAVLRLSQPIDISWETQPYGPLSAIVWAVAVDPEDAETLYAGVYGGGVYKSADSGKTWQPKNVGLEAPGLTSGNANYALNIQDILISRIRPQTLYVATQSGDGIYRSDDGGEHWQREIVNVWDTEDFALAGGSVQVRTLLETEDALFAGTAAGVFSITAPYTSDWYPTSLKGVDVRVRALLAHPTDSDILYAATLGQGIYKSTDGGQTWLTKTVSLERGAAQRVNTLVFDPDDADVMVAGTFGDGVYRSMDAGETWEAWSEGLPKEAEVWSLGYAPDGTLFAGFRQGGTYIRTVSTSWQKLAASGALALEMDHTTGVVYVGTWGGGVYCADVATSYQDWQTLHIPTQYLRLTTALYHGDRIYVGTDSNGVYASADHGVSWERLGEGLAGVSLGVQTMAVNPRGNTLYLGTGEGILTESVDAAAWVSVTNPISNVFSVIALSVTEDAQGNDVVYVGTAAQGLWMYDTGTHTWSGPQPFRYRTTEKVTAYVPSILANDEQAYASVWGSGVHRSISAGPWPPLQLAPKYVESLVLARKAWFQWGGRHFYAQTEQGLYGSADGETWSLLYPGLVDTVLLDPLHPQVIYASVTNNLDAVQSTGLVTATAMFIGLNDGRDVHPVSSTLPFYGGSVVQLVRDPQDKGFIFALVASGGLYRGQVALPWLGREVAAWGVVIGLLYAIFVLIPFGHFSLVEIYTLSHATAVDLLLRHPVLLLRLWRPRFQNRLEPLEKLILALVEKPQFELIEAWDYLDTRGIITSRPLLVEALNRLAAHRIVHENEGTYTYAARGLPLIAMAVFAPRVAELSEIARRENRLLTDVADFFEAAGFDVRQGAPQHLTSLVLRPRRPLYHDYPQLCVRLKTREPLTAEDVRASCVEICERANMPQDVLPVVFFVVDVVPEVAAFRQMRMEGARIQVIPLSVAAIRRAQRDHAEQRDVDWFVQNPRVHSDLFDVRAPVVDQLDFFGREGILAQLKAAIDREPQITVWGLPGSGKTSLLWAVKETLVTPLVVYADLTRRWQGVDTLHEQLVIGLIQDLWAKYNRFFETQMPDFEQTLLALAEAIPVRDISDRRVVLLLDGVVAGSGSETGREVACLQALAQQHASVTVVVAWQSGAAPSLPWSPLGTLDANESARMLETLGARMGLTFDPAAVDEIYRRTGGHPLLLRQLSSLAVQPVLPLSPEETRRVLPAWIEDALPIYERLCDRHFDALWQWLLPETRDSILEWTECDVQEPFPESFAILWQAQGLFGALFIAWVLRNLEEDLL